jgi:hypothetical protein
VTPKDAAELLDVIIARAPALAAAGIRGRVELGAGISFTVAAEEPGAAPAPAGESIPALVDALDDPATHGQFGPDAPRRRPRFVRPPLLEE